jgi:hypothetical protein
MEVSFNQRHIRTKYRDTGHPDTGLAGTREFGLKIGTFPQKPGRVATLAVSAVVAVKEDMDKWWDATTVLVTVTFHVVLRPTRHMESCAAIVTLQK